MRFEIRFTSMAAQQILELRAYDRTMILDAIVKQLEYQPTEVTKNKKILIGLVPPWEFSLPLRELRVGEIRVFYDVDETNWLVVVRAVRHKPPHRRTEEIL